MKPLSEMLRLGKSIRVAGFDDAPFEKRAGAAAPVGGIICSGTRFEGMLWGRATVDGDDATDAIAGLLLGSKFHAQVHLVLTDGLTVGGFNLLDLADLAARLDRPCVAVMRRPPDLPRFRMALARFADGPARLARLDAAGPIHSHGPFVFQVRGAPPEHIGPVLEHLTDRGHVPEALRLAHLIGSAVITGQSGRRA